MEAITGEAITVAATEVEAITAAAITAAAIKVAVATTAAAAGTDNAPADRPGVAASFGPAPHKSRPVGSTAGGCARLQLQGAMSAGNRMFTPLARTTPAANPRTRLQDR
jgi:hypothetical protein